MSAGIAPGPGYIRSILTRLLAAGGYLGTGTAAGGDLNGSTYPNPEVAPGKITLAKQANIATDRLIGRDTAGTGVPEALTVGGGVEFSGSGGIQRSALTGDVTASAASGATTIAARAVTMAKLVAATATDKLLGRSTAGSGDFEEIACTAAARTLLAAATAVAQLAALNAGLAPLGFTGSVTTTDATQTTCGTYTPVDGDALALDVTVVASSGGATIATFSGKVAARRAGGTTTIVGLIALLKAGDAGATTWAATVDASGAAIRVRITGQVATAIKWTTCATVITQAI